jgi:hypothetical protein
MVNYLNGEEVRRYLFETNGVPSGIDLVSNYIYKFLLNDFIKNPEEYTYNQFNYKIEKPFEFGGYFFGNINIVINIKHGYSDKNIDLSNTAILNNKKLNIDNLKIVEAGFRKNELIFNFINNFGELYKEDLHLFFVENETLLKVKITHELKHLFDNIVKPNFNLSTIIDYDASVRVETKIPPLNDFMFAIYFTSDIEKSVRNSELFSLLQQNKVTKQNFREFLNSDDTIKRLKIYQNISFNDVINEIKTKYLDVIKNELSRYSQNYDFENMNPDEVVKKYLSAFYLGFVRSMDFQLKKYIVNFPEDIQKIQNNPKFKKELDKIFNLGETKYLNYFYEKEKIIKNSATETLKKIHKLFNLLSEGKQFNINEEFVIKKYSVSY